MRPSIKVILAKIYRYWFDPAYRRIKRSGLFDADYYAAQYGDIDLTATDPLVHYVVRGWREERYPNPLFDASYYRKTYLETGEGHPLLHYLETGWQQGCNPVPLFDTAFYLRQYGALLRPGQTPLAHYLQNWRRGFEPNPLFDTAYYCTLYPHVLDPGIIPLADYLHGPDRRHISTSPLFDMQYYLEANPVVRREWLFPVLHYLKHGNEPQQKGPREKYRPNPLLDLSYYRAEYLNETTPFLEAFYHYAHTGIAAQHRPHALFDPHFYQETSADILAADEPPFLHYLKTGQRQGDYPCREVAQLTSKPLLSIVTPVYNTNEHLLRRCVHSVLRQFYPHWELCLVDDGSPAAHVSQVLAELAASDDRIRVAKLDQNQGIAAATNAAVAMATGEFLAFLDHDDELPPEALYHIAQALQDEDTEVVYSDEDLVDLENQCTDIFRKPRFNRELLLNHNYITHFFVVRKALFDRCGGLRSEYDGAQDYDQALKLTEQAKKIVHIPRVLYHWRAHGSSTSINPEQKHYADEAGRKALQAALDRRDIAGQAECTGLRFFYRARRAIIGNPSLAILCDPGFSCWDALIPEARTPKNWQLVEVIMSGETPPLPFADSAQLLEPVAGESVLTWRNRAFALATADYVCFVGAGAIPDAAGWLEALLEYGQPQDTGLVGGQVDEEDNPAHRHRGSLPDIKNGSWRYYAACVRDVSVQHNGIHCPQNALAVHHALCLLRREHGLADGLYDPGYHHLEIAQLDFCLRLHARGLGNVYTSYAKAALRVNAHCLREDEASGAQDRLRFQQRWQTLLRAGDPYHNPQLLADHGIAWSDFLRWYAGAS